tara:strand:+ start:339 stop:1115 length:777 start_codon:yes stop_codon:yes gene_type:complete
MQTAFGQHKECSLSTFQQQSYYHNSDTFLIVRAEYTSTSEFLETSTTHSYLFKKNNRQLDTILKLDEGFAGDDEYTDYSNNSELLSDYLYSITYPESPYDYDSTVYNFYTSYDISPIKANVMAITESDWEYTGGAHGHGQSHYSFFDIDSNAHFGFDDVFKPSVMETIYDKVKKEFYFEGKYYDLTSEEFDDESSGQRYLTSQQYQFEEDSLIICVQMYDTLFGVIYVGYNYWEMGIAYKDLKRHMYKHSPIWRMLKE